MLKSLGGGVFIKVEVRTQNIHKDLGALPLLQGT